VNPLVLLGEKIGFQFGIFIVRPTAISPLAWMFATLVVTVLFGLVMWALAREEERKISPRIILCAALTAYCGITWLIALGNLLEL
jgi:hypothetical protein